MPKFYESQFTIPCQTVYQQHFGYGVELLHLLENFVVLYVTTCSLQVLEDNPTLSRWSLKYNAFGQDIEFSWLARNLQANNSIP